MKDRGDYEKANKLKGEFSELLGRSCDFCRENPWDYDVTPKDDDGLIYLTGFGCLDDYALACKDCFKQYFMGFTWTHEGLVY